LEIWRERERKREREREKEREREREREREDDVAGTPSWVVSIMGPGQVTEKGSAFQTPAWLQHESSASTAHWSKAYYCWHPFHAWLGTGRGAAFAAPVEQALVDGLVPRFAFSG
jgi:hypothetical protein